MNKLQKDEFKMNLSDTVECTKIISSDTLHKTEHKFHEAHVQASFNDRVCWQDQGVS